MFPTYPDLEGRTALVTGASSGIGRGIAQALLHQGMRVSAQHRTQLSPPGTFPVQADLGTERGCVEAVRAAHEKLGNIDLLVHSAGIYNAGPIASISAAGLEEMFRVNAFSAFYLVRELLPLGLRHVAFLRSPARHGCEPGHSHYEAHQ